MGKYLLKNYALPCPASLRVAKTAASYGVAGTAGDCGEDGIYQSNLKRSFLYKSGTFLSNVLLGTKLHDATSGFQGFHADIVEKFVNYPLLSTAHFYQTEIRYLLRKTRFVEVPIHYRAPSPSVSKKAIINSFAVLGHYLMLRIKLRAAIIR
jgi:dolichol-phosphate mannosyltransferase